MTDFLPASVEVYCPVCHKRGIIEVKKEIIDENYSGITAVHIEKNLICTHSFLTYLDNNFVIRDCFAYDFSVILPQMTLEGLDSPLLEDIFDIDIVKYNLLPSLLGNVLKGILYRSKISIINDLDFLNENF